MRLSLRWSPRRCTRDKATMYADCFLEYEAATANISKNGVIVAHPERRSR